MLAEHQAEARVWLAEPLSADPAVKVPVHTITRRSAALSSLCDLRPADSGDFGSAQKRSRATGGYIIPRPVKASADVIRESHFGQLNLDVDDGKVAQAFVLMTRSHTTGAPCVFARTLHF